jgi:hypothetical protein
VLGIPREASSLTDFGRSRRIFHIWRFLFSEKMTKRWLCIQEEWNAHILRARRFVASYIAALRHVNFINEYGAYTWTCEHEIKMISNCKSSWSLAKSALSKEQILQALRANRYAKQALSFAIMTDVRASTVCHSGQSSFYYMLMPLSHNYRLQSIWAASSYV